MTPTFICSYHLLDKVAPVGTATEAFTWSASLLLAGIALGSAVSGTLVDLFGVQLALFGAGLSTTISILIVLFLRQQLGDKQIQASAS